MDNKLAKALRELVADLEERAKWMHFVPAEDGKTVPCGAGVYLQAKQALMEHEAAND